MARPNISLKQLQVNKANSTIVTTIALASFVVVFSLVASRSLLSQRSYQSRVIKEKEKAAAQLKENVTAVESLTASYAAFVNSSENVLGGNPAGTGDRDGDNARIILDALPSKYDFPALASSLEKILTENSFGIEVISGTDDEINQQNMESPNPAPVEMPFQITVTGSYDSMEKLVSILQRSIRPIQIQTLEFSGSDSAIRLNMNAKTYYQPEKSLMITTKEVR